MEIGMTLRAGPYASVERELAGTTFTAIRYVEETGSTNADAAGLVSSPQCAGLTIVAEYQRCGAARKGRTWQAAAGTSLLFSTILPRTVAAADLWVVPFWTALAVRRGLVGHGVVTIVQWPNDLLLVNRKIAGVLCQSSVTGASARVVCGVGINVHRWADAATAITPPPAFCDDVAEVDRQALLAAILREYEHSLPLLGRPNDVIAAWNDAAELPGRRYRIVRDGSTADFEGVAQGLGTGGELRVRRADGTIESVSLADARVLR